MAVKTQFSAQELKDIVSGYDVGKYQSHKAFEQGADQTNIFLITEQAKFAFRYYEKRTPEYVPFEINLLQYLASHSYPSPSPIKNKNGKYLGIYNGKPFALFEFLEGKHDDSEDNFKEVAKAIGKLHTLTIGYKLTNSGARDTYDQVSSWNNATSNAGKINPQSEAEGKLAWFGTEIDKLQLLSTMPKGAVHGDTNPSNFLYKDGRISAVLDFDQASYTYLLYDIANLLYWWVWPNKGNFDFTKAKSILNEYETLRKLTDEEKFHLFDMLQMVNFMGISWFIDDNEDFINGKRKTECLNSIGRKNFYEKLFGQAA